MHTNKSIGHAATPDRSRQARLAVPTALATVACVLTFGPATAHTDRSDAGSANTMERAHTAAQSQAIPLRGFHSADAAARWLAAAAPTVRGFHSADAAARRLAATASEDSGGRDVVRLSSPAGTGITSVDVGESGQSVGDYLVFNHPVLNQAMTRERGDLRGECVFVGDTTCEGDVTFDLAEGLVTVEGPFDLTRGTNVFALTGGTGAYRKARGILRVRSTEERNDYVLRVTR